MVREAACGRTPAPARRAIHARAAELCLRTGGIDTGAESVFHFFRAGEPERAARLLLSLGGELIAAGELEECRFLLDLVDAGKHGEADGLQRLRQDLLAAYGEWDLGYEYLFQCSVLSAATGVKLERPGRTTRSEKEWQEALSDHERGLEVLAGAGDTAGRCELLSSLGWMRLLRGEARQAEEAYRRILAFPKDDGCMEATLKAQLGLGHAAWLSGKNAAAATRYRVTLRKLGPTDAAFRIAALNYIANLASAEKELAAAAGLLEEAAGLCKTGRHRRERAYTLLHLGRVRSLLGRADEAGRTLTSALAEFRGIGDLHGSVFSELALAAHQLSLGENSRARELSEHAAKESIGPELASIREHALLLASMAGRTEKARSENQRKASG
jgi:tetratricopeptide (TPR) repeat protein